MQLVLGEITFNRVFAPVGCCTLWMAVLVGNNVAVPSKVDEVIGQDTAMPTAVAIIV